MTKYAKVLNSGVPMNELLFFQYRLFRRLLLRLTKYGFIHRFFIIKIPFIKDFNNANTNYFIFFNFFKVLFIYLFSIWDEVLLTGSYFNLIPKCPLLTLKSL